MTRRVGAIDCGTNSIRLLVADIDDDGSLRDVTRQMQIVRLGHGVDRTGVIAPDAMHRTLTAAREYAGTCLDFGASAVRFVATSASRDAANAGDFIAGVREAFSTYGIAPEVISGDEEAGLSFSGATGDLRAAAIRGPYLVVDIGGGSTEFVRGTAVVEQARSVDVGCVRMTERRLRSDPPTAAEIDAAVADIDAAIDRAEADVDIAPVRTLVGLAGSVTTVTAYALGLVEYDAAQIHLARLPVPTVLAACDDLVSMSRADRAMVGSMHPGRVDVIGAGALVWSRVIRRVVERTGITDVVTSEHDILDGIALSIV